MITRSIATLAFALSAFTLHPGTGIAACDCATACKAYAANCLEHVKLSESVEKYECTDQASQQALDCGFEAASARDSCVEMCALDLSGCLKSAKSQRKECAKDTKRELKSCLAVAKTQAKEFKAFCKNELPAACLQSCAPHCFDGTTNEDETDVDCGGGACFRCGDGAQCLSDSDCRSFACQSGTCVTPDNCFDGEKNQDETGVDCGGSFCFPCDDGKACGSNTDCASGTCTGETCQPYTCSAVPAAIPSTVVGDTSTGTPFAGGGCQFPTAQPGVAYTITTSEAGVLHLALESQADLGLSVRTTCADDETELACADFVSGGTETLDIDVTTGQTLFVVVRGFRTGAAGPFSLGIELLPIQ